MSGQILTGIASAAIALAALIFSIISFQRQQSRAELTATRNVKPLLWIKSLTYVNHKSIDLWNYGLGPAIIKSAQFEKEGQKTNNIVELFAGVNSPVPPPARPVGWVTFSSLLPNRAIPAQSHITLLEQSLENLRSQGMDEDSGLELLRRWMDRKKGIEARIEYADIFDNKMEELKETLH